MAILDLVEFLDPTGEIIVHKWPEDGSGEIRLGSQLVVQESQKAFFYRDGKFLDSFGPGRYTLHTNNLPLLGGVIGAPFGGRSPFRCYVYFLSTKVFTNMGWGTASPVMFRDTDFRMISLRAYGAYSIRINDPVVFLNTLVGTKGMEYTKDLEDFFRTIIVSHLNEIIGMNMKSILDLPVMYSKIAESVKDSVCIDFGQYGIELIDLLVEAITPPPEVQQMLNRATGVAAQDAEKYKAIAVADATLEAAKNPGEAGSAIGGGIGLGIGLSMAQNIAQQMGVSNSVASSQQVVEKKLTVEEVKAKLVALKELLDQNLITNSDYEEQKRKLLAQM